MRGESTFKLPNQLITDGSLSFTARRMGAVLYSRSNRLGTCRKSLQSLAKLACCTVATAYKALSELERTGYITRSRGYRFDPDLRRPVYDCNTYHCVATVKSFTLIPRRIFQQDLSASCFVMCLYLFQQAGNGSRAYPSIRRMEKALSMAHSTVCRCLQVLRAGGLWLVQTCKKLRQDLACNSYHLLHCTKPAPVQVAVCAGGDSVLSRIRRLTKRVLAAPLSLFHSIRAAVGRATPFCPEG